MNTEWITLSAERSVTLTAYLQSVGGEFRNIARRPAVLVLPGGDYQFCSDREADPVALPYLAAGFQVFILRYSVRKDAAWPQPLKDYDKAMALIRANAQKWAVAPDKIAVIGFSAGGHLAAAAATMAQNRPDAAILGYAVAGSDIDMLGTGAPNPTEYVDKRTCPCFLFATRNDRIVPIANTIDFMDALARNDISFESHIYAFGPHGFSTCDISVQDRSAPLCNRVPHWVPDSIGWLRDIFGEFDVEGFTAPRCGHWVNGNYAPFLSVDYTVSHLLNVPEARAAMDKLVTSADGKINPIVMNMTLRECLRYATLPDGTLEALDARLRAIPNPDKA